MITPYSQDLASEIIDLVTVDNFVAKSIQEAIGIGTVGAGFGGGLISFGAGVIGGAIAGGITWGVQNYNCEQADVTCVKNCQ